MRVFAFYSAILIYAGFSSPTPDAFGWAEIIVGGLLLIAIHPILTSATLLQNSLPSPLGFHRFFFVFMLSVPLMIGAVNGNQGSDIVRDVIPLLFLIFPFCFIQNTLERLPFILMIGGTVFAFRYLIIALPNMLTLGFQAEGDSLLYLANSPLVPFACLYGFSLLSSPQTELITKRVLGLTITTITFLAMATMVQRAPLALSFLGCTGIICARFWCSPLKITLICIFICVLTIPLWGIADQVIHGMWDKTLTVGFNNRLEEFEQVLAQTSIFGNGWGAIWQSPAVGDYWVRYTHNMTSYYLLKTGFIGAILSIVFIYVWGKEGIKAMRHSFALGLSLFIPLIIHMSLYTGYKTFDFALLILLTFLCNRNRHAF